jgi:hypothetical protein
MTCPDDPPPLPIPLLPVPIVLPEAGPLIPAVGAPLPPLDESHWRFVFQDDPDFPEDQEDADEEQYHAP